MKFVYAEAMTDPTFYLPLAQAAEKAGYNGVTIADSLFYPKQSDSKYPYTPDGDRGFLENKAFIEPMILMAAIGAVTTKLNLVPFVIKLPVRNPLMVAKQLSSLAFMTNNRVKFGVGLSPWPDDFAGMGVPWAKRGKRMDECIDIIRGLVTGDYYEFHSQMYDFEPLKMTPAPTEPVPILIGGHSDAALKRAARVGDGWIHAGGDEGELEQMLTKLNEFRRAEGTSDNPFDVYAISMDSYSVDGVKRLEEKGVTHSVVGFRLPYQVEQDSEPLTKKIDDLNKFADNIIAKVEQ